MIHDFAEIVAARNLVFDFAEDFANFVFDRVRASGLLLKSVQIGEEFAVDEEKQIVADSDAIVVDFSISSFGRGPDFPAVGSSRMKV
jgi:hypothetical protein